jgi:hypothetical protein
MHSLRRLLICLAASAAALTSVDAAHAQSATFTGNIYYYDCVTPIGGTDYVTITVYAADNKTVLTGPTKVTSSYNVSVTTTGTNRNVFIKFYFNANGSGNPDRILQGIDGNDGRVQTIDVTMPAAGASTPSGAVILSGKLYQANGTTKLTPAVLAATAIIAKDSAGTTVGSITAGTLTTFTYQFTATLPTPAPADGTITLYYYINGTLTWTLTGVVGSGRQQTIDIAQ